MIYNKLQMLLVKIRYNTFLIEIKVNKIHKQYQRALEINLQKIDLLIL